MKKFIKNYVCVFLIRSALCLRLLHKFDMLIIFDEVENLLYKLKKPNSEIN